MIKVLATAIALVLTLGLITSVYAQGQNATSLQIQIVPEIQRGHQQHLTIYSVDDQGNEINGTGEIITSITNARGNLVGPKTVYTETGEDVSYKVGPNTSPQNITVDSCLSYSEICASQTYFVFPKGQAQQPPIIQVPEPTTPIPEPIPPNDTDDGEIIVPSNETEVTAPENGTDVTINDTGEAEPLPPISNETAPPEQPEIPIEVNETIPIPVPSNETSQNETIPVPLPINETSDTNQTIPIPELPVEPELPPTGETGNQTEELPVEIPAQNETDTIPIELPINSSTGNETIPIPEIPIEPPTTNQTQNTTVEPTPLPENGGTQTPNGTTPAEPEPVPVNASSGFDQLANATAMMDQKLDEVRDDGTDANRGELKALIGETAGAIGQVSDVVVNATEDQLLVLQDTFVAGSESIDEILGGNEEQQD